MLYPKSPLYQRLLDRIQALPVIDCHEHLTGPEARPKYKEPIAALIPGYVQHDLESAAVDIHWKEVSKLWDEEVSTSEKWPLFEKLWQRVEHTAYARMTKLVLE